jgi:hypothetical protein
MLRPILVMIGVVVVSVLVYAHIQPDSFRVERSTSIHASPNEIAPLIYDLQTFNTWNPYAKKDPTMKGSYSGPASGPGAGYAFDSESAGTGSIRIVDVEDPSRVTMQLDFVKPFEVHNTVEFELEPNGDATQVSWAMHGPRTYLSKLMGVVFDMDKMIGTDFEAGLRDLKAIAERT